MDFITSKKSKPNLLVTQQITNALNDFYKMVLLATDDADRIEVLLLQNYVPYEIHKIEKENSILYARNGLVKCMFYYDPTTLTYRASGGTHFTYDFIFIDEQLEKNRQILEIVHNMYNTTYGSAESEEYIDNLVRKFMKLTDHIGATDSITDLVTEKFNRETDKIKTE